MAPRACSLPLQAARCSQHLLCPDTGTQTLSRQLLTHLAVDKIPGFESVQLQEVPKQGDVGILDCVMQNCLVAFHVLITDSETKHNERPAEQLKAIM